MKKLFFFACIAIAIASFGVHSNLAHAQTAPAGTQSTATLEQELQVMKATLVNLQMKEGLVPAGDAGLPGGSITEPAPSAPMTSTGATGLSATDQATLQSELGSLVTALSSLNTTLEANPQAVASHQQAIAMVLSGMRSTVVSMGNVLNGTPIAAATPSHPTSGGISTSAPVATQSPAPTTPTPIASTQPAPSTGSLAPTAAPAGVNNPVGTQTAQASNAWGFVVNHWPTITIVVLVALILLILFWPSSEGDEDKHAVRPPVKPQTPSRPVTTTVMRSEGPAPTPPATTPVATIVANPSKVTVVRPQDQQKKPA